MSFVGEHRKVCPNCKSFEIINEIKRMTIDLKEKMKIKTFNNYCHNCMLNEIVNQNKILKIYSDYYKKILKDIERSIIKNNNLFH
jgi:hypothetical protein